MGAKETFSRELYDCAAQCMKSGFELPYTFVGVHPNDAVWALRLVHRPEQQEQAQAELQSQVDEELPKMEALVEVVTLFDTGVDGAYPGPVHVLAVDANGSSGLITLTQRSFPTSGATH